MQQFKEMLLEEIDQLEEMAKYSQHTRNEIFGIIMFDDEIKSAIRNNEHRINELNQLLCVMEDTITIDDLQEITSRFKAVKDNVKHEKRLDSDAPNLIYIDV